MFSTKTYVPGFFHSRRLCRYCCALEIRKNKNNFRVEIASEIDGNASLLLVCWMANDNKYSHIGFLRYIDTIQHWGAWGLRRAGNLKYPKGFVNDCR